MELLNDVEDTVEVLDELENMPKEEQELMAMLEELRNTDKLEYQKSMKNIIKKLKNDRNIRRRRWKKFIKVCMGIKMIVAVVLIIVL
jgi:t-SNARE complex subunit (syntaxin)